MTNKLYCPNCITIPKFDNQEFCQNCGATLLKNYTMPVVNNSNLTKKPDMKKINNVQKTILTIILPLVVFIAAIGIASQVSYSKPFDWEDTWFVWFLAVGLVGFIEYKIYENK